MIPDRATYISAFDPDIYDLFTNTGDETMVTY